MKKASLTMLSIFTLFLVWVVAYGVVSNDLILPTPWHVLLAFFSLFTSKASLTVILSTLLRLLLSMLAAGLVGFLLGIFAGFHSKLAIFLRPYVTILRTIPVISVFVIMIVLFGLKTTPYLITFLMIFPIIFQSVYEGIRTIDPEMIDVYRLEDNHFWTALRYCYIPFINTPLKTALLQSAGLGVKVLVMAEYLAQTRTSIGNALYLAKANLEYDQVFAWTILLILLAVVIEIFIERYAVLGKKGQNSRKISND
ncbi:MAG: ABC transporter permease [Candidatus Izemoplasmatales bacterium]